MPEKRFFWTKEELHQLYVVEGKTTYEIAAMFKCAPSTVFFSLKRNGVELRTRESSSGVKHYGWKGDNASHRTLHQRLDKMFGKPRKCEHCGTTTASRYEWANETGNYADPYDYVRLCKKCHTEFDRYPRDRS